jgi:hypothetical protein
MTDDIVIRKMTAFPPELDQLFNDDDDDDDSSRVIRKCYYTPPARGNLFISEPTRSIRLRLFPQLTQEFSSRMVLMELTLLVYGFELQSLKNLQFFPFSSSSSEEFLFRPTIHLRGCFCAW